MNYKMLIQYDGTRYKGWQVQKSTELTIQGTFQKLLSEYAKEEVEVIGSGRTDAGVHAKGQVANFHIKGNRNDSEKIQKFLDKNLPKDIAVISLAMTDEKFHSRFNAKSKFYRYRIHMSERSNVFERKYVYVYTAKQLDLEKMQQAAKLLEGTKDFKSFCGNKKMTKSTVRTVSKINVYRNGDEIVLDFYGDGFLMNMIRIMVGTLMEVGNGTRDIESIEPAIEAKDRSLAGFLAPASGLCLMEVGY